jgi:hypothetical protein
MQYDGHMTLKPSSRTRLTPHTLQAFPGDTLHDALGRAISAASCLPRKEFFEAWAVAKRVRRRLRARRVVELAAGHGLVAFMLLLLDREVQEAVCVDRRQPESFDRLQAALADRWPRLGEQVRYVEGRVEDESLDADSLVVSVHACGVLTDRVLDLAIAARAPVAVLPCCHAIKRSDTGALTGWLDDALAVDVTRAARLRQAGYRIFTQTIPETITPQNRLLLGEPVERSGA